MKKQAKSVQSIKEIGNLLIRNSKCYSSVNLTKLFKLNSREVISSYL